jgi:acetyl-CoA carboxylase biotin carboxyl carrier protein
MKKIERKTRRTAGGAAKATKTAAPRSKAVTDSGDNLSLSEIRSLIELISDKQFNEFELERGNLKLRLSKGVIKTPIRQEPTGIAEQSLPAVSAAVAQPQHFAIPPVTASEPAPAKEEENLHTLTSPIVGTFYRSATPTAKPFVAVGDRVEPGTVLCIIEAMKLMNEIQADAGGVIAKIFVENGQPVEYGQALFGIKI